MLKYEVQAPSAGPHREMSLEGLGQLQPLQPEPPHIGGSLAPEQRNVMKGYVPVVSGDKELCVSFG